MEISLSSIFSSIVSTSLLTILLFWLLKKKKIVTRFGLGCMYLMILLILCRGLVPIDFYSIGLTNSIYSRHLLPWLRDLLITELGSINSFIVTPIKIILTIWLIGSIFSICNIVTSYLNTKKFLRTSPQITDARIETIFQNALDATYPKNHKPVFHLVLSDSFSSPAICGIYRPIIILPHLNYTEEELYFVFRHELLHYKHKDFIFKLFSNMISAIYWWNPLISRLLVSLTSQVQELWVDYHISQSSDTDQRIQYMHTLVTTLKQHNHGSLSPTEEKQILSFAQNQLSIKQRFSYIMEESIKSFTIYGIVICIALFISSFTIVLEPYYTPSTDETGQPVFDINYNEIYFIKNAEQYDMYVNGEYMGTIDTIPEDFKNASIYDSQEETSKNEH